MMIENLFSVNDYFIILAIVILTNQLKKILKKFNVNAHLYVFIPLIFIFPVVIFQYVFKISSFFEMLISLIKYWVGAVFFYDVVVERFKIKKQIIEGGEDENNKNNKNDIDNNISDY